MSPASRIKVRQDQEAGATSQMSRPLVISMSLHIGLFVVAMIGLPFLSPQLPPLSDPIPVEIVNVEEFAQTNRPPARAEQPPTPRTQTRAEPPRPVQPTVTENKPPRAVAPTPPEPPPRQEPVQEAVAPPEPTPSVPPRVPPQKPERVAQAEPEKQPEPAEEAKPPSEDEFRSLLRNMIKNDPQPRQLTAVEEAPAEQPTPVATLSDRMSMSEMDALRRQLSRCWSLMAGARFAEDQVVQIRLNVNPDRTVRSAHIVDQIRYNTDSFFRAAADSAMRAVHNPHCSPLELPPDKHTQWRDLIVRFDPREML